MIEQQKIEEEKRKEKERAEIKEKVRIEEQERARIIQEIAESQSRHVGLFKTR